ncbi:hypothetical protein DFP73DRAFT_537643 [Morchella snyderi]|nr:hypothetical protein DFP73DRAFT_537643 [Morchella snyderi]
MISTQISTWTTQQTVTATATPSTSATVVPSTIAVGDTPTIGGASPKTPNVEVIVGACFGALVGFIGIFVLAYLWSKKRREENLRKESVGFSNGSFLRSSPGAGSGVRGMIGSLRRGPSTRYNNIPSGEAMPNMSPLPAPPHSPPPQLPQLRVMPPSGEFSYEYTFGSPVSSIGEAQLHALTSGAISPPVMENHQDGLFFSLPRQESEQPPWSSPMVEQIAVAETVVSSVSAQSARSNEPTASTVSGTQSPTRKPVPTATNDLVLP